MLRFVPWLGVVLAVVLSLPATGWCDPSRPVEYDCPGELSSAGDDDVPHIEQPPPAPIATIPATGPPALRGQRTWSAGDSVEALAGISRAARERFAEILRWTKGWRPE